MPPLKRKARFSSLAQRRRSRETSENGGGGVTREEDELLSVGEVGGEPVQCGAFNHPFNTQLAHPLKEDGVTNSVKGCTEIEEGPGICGGKRRTADAARRLERARHEKHDGNEATMPGMRRRGMRRMRMRPWLEEQINSCQIPGLSWINREKRIFRVPWIHASCGGWDLEKDAPLFMRWAIHTGKYRPGVDRPDPKKWKTNFRCAMNSLQDIEEVKDNSINTGSNAFKVYKILCSTERSTKRALSAEPPVGRSDTAGARPSSSAIAENGGKWDDIGGTEQITVVRIDDSHIAGLQAQLVEKGRDEDTGLARYEIEYSIPMEEESEMCTDAEIEEEEEGVYVFEYSNAEEEGESYQFKMSVGKHLPTKQQMKHPTARGHFRRPLAQKTLPKDERKKKLNGKKKAVSFPGSVPHGDSSQSLLQHEAEHSGAMDVVSTRDESITDLMINPHKIPDG